MSIFLPADEIVRLTGRKVKSKQIDALRKMGIPYFVNATGHPVVTTAAVEGKKETPQPSRWTPNVIRTA